MSAFFDAGDMEVKREVKTVNWTSLPHAAFYTARTASPEGSLLTKAGKMLDFAVKGLRV